jgi:hypothetical protein
MEVETRDFNKYICLFLAFHYFVELKVGKDIINVSDVNSFLFMCLLLHSCMELGMYVYLFIYETWHVGGHLFILTHFNLVLVDFNLHVATCNVLPLLLFE